MFIAKERAKLRPIQSGNLNVVFDPIAKKLYGYLDLNSLIFLLLFL